MHSLRLASATAWNHRRLRRLAFLVLHLHSQQKRRLKQRLQEGRRLHCRAALSVALRRWSYRLHHRRKLLNDAASVAQLAALQRQRRMLRQWRAAYSGHQLAKKQHRAAAQHHARRLQRQTFAAMSWFRHQRQQSRQRQRRLDAIALRFRLQQAWTALVTAARVSHALFNRARATADAMRARRTRVMLALMLVTWCKRAHQSGLLARALCAWHIRCMRWGVFAWRRAVRRHISSRCAEQHVVVGASRRRARVALAWWRQQLERVLELRCLGSELSARFRQGTLSRTFTAWRAVARANGPLRFAAREVTHACALRRQAAAVQEWRKSVQVRDQEAKIATFVATGNSELPHPRHHASQNGHRYRERKRVAHQAYCGTSLRRSWRRWLRYHAAVEQASQMQLQAEERLVTAMFYGLVLCLRIERLARSLTSCFAQVEASVYPPACPTRGEGTPHMGSLAATCTVLENCAARRQPAAERLHIALRARVEAHDCRGTTPALVPYSADILSMGATRTR